MEELCLDYLIEYMKRKYAYGDLTISSNIIDEIGDGVNIYSLLEDLEDNFNVDFSNFDYDSYFHSEEELCDFGCLFFWKKKKERPVEKFTPLDLYNYMIKNKK